MGKHNNYTKAFLEKYFVDYNKVLDDFLKDDKTNQDLIAVAHLLEGTRETGNVIYLVGNGGSSAIAEHMAIDLTKNAGLKALTVSGTPMLTTFSNDFGYEKVFEKGIEIFANPGDILIAVSSSGQSKNILNACEAAKKKGMKVVTFSGFQADNPLRKTGDYNFWVNTKAFGYVEILHNLIIHAINDMVIGSAVYMIR